MPEGYSFKTVNKGLIVKMAINTVANTAKGKRLSDKRSERTVYKRRSSS